MAGNINDSENLVQQFLERRQLELTELTTMQHNKALAFTAIVTALFYIAGLTSSQMIVGEISCDPQVNQQICSNLTITHKNINIGLWTADLLGDSYALCDQWPNSSNSVCDSIRTVRAFIFLGIVTALLAVIGSIVRAMDKKEILPLKVVVALATSGICGMIAYSVWQGNCASELNAMARDQLASQPGIRYWTTLGTSYGLIMWGWIFPLGFLSTKLFLPGLNKHVDKRMKRESYHNQVVSGQTQTQI